MRFKETFGEYVRRLREEKRLPLRKVAAHLDIDPSTLSKIERNDRCANREMVIKFSEILGADPEYLLVSLLSDRVTSDLINEDCSHQVLEAAEEKIKYFRAMAVKQSELKLK